MNELPNTAIFNRSIYRDFALFALAAIGVGLAVSLTLATAIVLSTPNRDPGISNPPVSELPRMQQAPKVQTAKLGAGFAAV